MINIGSILPVGTIIHSMLSTAQFATEYGDNWVLADGRSVTGSRYASVTGLSTIPDMRGAFLRAKNNGGTRNPDGDLSLGSYSADKFSSHNHGVLQPVSGSGAYCGGVQVVTPAFNKAPNYNTTDGYGHPYSQTLGSNETAPKSITVNIFIRIN